MILFITSQHWLHKHHFDLYLNFQAPPHITSNFTFEWIFTLFFFHYPSWDLLCDAKPEVLMDVQTLLIVHTFTETRNHNTSMQWVERSSGFRYTITRSLSLFFHYHTRLQAPPLPPPSLPPSPCLLACLLAWSPWQHNANLHKPISREVLMQENLSVVLIVCSVVSSGARQGRNESQAVVVVPCVFTNRWHETLCHLGSLVRCDTPPRLSPSPPPPPLLPQPPLWLIIPLPSAVYDGDACIRWGNCLICCCCCNC